MGLLTQLFKRKTKELREIDEIGVLSVKQYIDDPIPYESITLKGLISLASELGIVVPQDINKKKLYSLVFNKEVE